MNHAIRKTTDGAMMIALVGVILFINRQLAGMIEYLMQWVLTFPILVYAAKYGMKASILTGICMLLLSVMLGTPTTIFYMFCCVVTGMVYGGGIRKQWKNGYLLIITFLFTLFSYSITFLIFATMFGYDASEDAQIAQLLLSFLHVDSPLPLSQIIGLVTIISTFLMSMLQTLCIHMLANTLLTRLHMSVIAMKSIFDIHINRWCGIIIIVIWLLFYGQSMLKLNKEFFSILFIASIMASIIAIAYGAMLLMSFCIITHKRAGVFLVMTAVFIPYLQMAIAGIGVLDMLFNMKDKMKRGVHNGPLRKF